MQSQAWAVVKATVTDSVLLGVAAFAVAYCSPDEEGERVAAVSPSHEAVLLKVWVEPSVWERMYFADPSPNANVAMLSVASV